MSSLETIQKLIPWAADLPPILKVAVSLVVLLLAFIFLYAMWAPKPSLIPYEDPSVIESYKRMKRVLSKLERSDTGVLIDDGNPVEERLTDYYKHYIAIAEYLKEKPGDIKGAYEIIWEHGGQGRTFINDTEAYETVVSSFFLSYEIAMRAEK